MAEVSYQLRVGGQEPPPEVLENLTRIEVEEHATMASIMRMTFGIAVAASGDTWTVVDDEVFTRLAEVELSIKVGSDDPVPVIAGYVIETRAVFAENPGESSLEVVAMDATTLMNLEEKIKPWPNMSDSEIAEAIFGDYGLTSVVDSSALTRQEDDFLPIQRGTDIQFLRALAERNGFDLFVAAAPGGAEGHFHAPRLDEPPQGVLTVGFGGASNVASITVTHDGLRPTRARGDHWRAESNETQSGTADAVSLASLGGTSVLEGADQRLTLLARTGLVSASELQTAAQALVDRSSWAIRAEGELSTVRYESLLRARKPVSVRGLGQTLSGVYYVERVLHLFTEDGYSQQFSLRRNALSLSGSEEFEESGALVS